MIKRNINASEEEIESLQNYISGSYHLKLNEKLRENRSLTDQEMKNYKNLYNIIDKNRISEDMTVYRGIVTTEEVFEKTIGLNRSFTSSSKIKPFGSSKCCQLIIHLKKGSMAIDISNSYNIVEKEVLIAPGIFRCIKKYEKDMIKKIPSFDMSSHNMRVTYKEIIVPTIFYELEYYDIISDTENDEKKSEEMFRFNKKYIKSNKRSNKSRK